MKMLLKKISGKYIFFKLQIKYVSSSILYFFSPFPSQFLENSLKDISL